MDLKARSGQKQAAPAPGAPPGSPVDRRRLVFKVLLLALSVVMAAALAEVGLRLFFRDRFILFQDERKLLYKYDPELGWFPIPNSHDRLQASRVFSVEHNRQGFRGPEAAPSNKPVIAFLGDSFVWGYDADAPERFTDKLQASHPEWTVYNLGVSGYGTDQEYLLLQKYFDVFKPKVVFLLFCVENDHLDNCSNVRYGGYYKPYCVVAGKRVQLEGVPVPKGERVWLVNHPGLARSFLVRLFARIYFELTAPPRLSNPDPTGAILWDMRNYVHRKGAMLVMGLTMKDPKMEDFLRQVHIPYVEVDTKLRYKSYGGHWTPEGHTYVSQKIEEFLAKGKFMAESAPSRP
jgi:hypothetical protein